MSEGPLRKVPGLRVGYLCNPGPSGHLPRTARPLETPEIGPLGTSSGPISEPKRDRQKWLFCRNLVRHRYRDSNLGFRTENPVMEASSAHFGHVWAH